MTTSYNGWPASPDPNAIGVDRSFSVAGTVPFGNGGFAGGVRAGDVSTMLAYVANALHTRVEPMMTCADTGNLGYGCWGYNYRANANNPNNLSNHSSGTAIDYNAPRHPNGTSTGPNGGGGWTGAQYNLIQQILRECGGAVTWLNSNDPMHFDIKVNPSALATAVKNLPSGGSPVPPPVDWWDEMSDADKQQLLDDVAYIKTQVDFLYSNEVIEGQPYSKTAANFNDTRANGTAIAAVASQVDFIFQSELIPIDDADPGKGAYPFTKSAANFNDTRAIGVDVQGLVDDFAKAKAALLAALGGDELA